MIVTRRRIVKGHKKVNRFSLKKKVWVLYKIVLLKVSGCGSWLWAWFLMHEVYLKRGA